MEYVLNTEMDNLKINRIKRKLYFLLVYRFVTKKS
jgi:hypothetical protein